MKTTLLNTLPGARQSSNKDLVDSLGRRVTYLRLSVTDRCDLRCTYCMQERQTFLPKADLLDYHELLRLVDLFIARGVTKLRITGGEPLVRQDVMGFLEDVSRRILPGKLNELTLTTNGTQLARHASALAGMGIRRINVSLDTLDRETYARIARRDVLPEVLDGISAALDAGLRVKINAVALKGENQAELPDLITWAHRRGMDISLIETMPLGEGIAGRTDAFLPLSEVRADLEQVWKLDPLTDNTGGPSRYVRIRETGGRLGFISPLSHNFCEDCNRVRVTCTGMLYTCLGHEGGADLKAALRSQGDNAVDETLDGALGLKPKGHTFDAGSLETAATRRTMSVTGG
ncbi:MULTISPECIES: GTP 3',8-cyclase MoaA [unclassified Hyphomonas]|uniref:GTP 3',8-cyclase MoaA n=1 Tax=unclassified Hyphomonas TaxID=2630699 RepID=UPI000458BADD|nr:MULTISPECIES: GTP 3',8-cyclase MoaA [unclassified Hyphomonas]KCZ46658.1 hypothetical protein HY17_07895 [Hyphomonas sp. CY54-11-8]